MSAVAAPVAVRQREGSTHGFLVLRTLDGRTLAAGDDMSTAEGDRVTEHVVFRFRDGSVDDETTVYSQRGSFHMISDHHVQRGPAFKKPYDVTVDVAARTVTVRSGDETKDKDEVFRMDLPEDLANGMLPLVVKNLRAGEGARVTMVVAAPKPRVVTMVIAAEGEDRFSAAGERHIATRFRVKTELGGVAGVVAPVIGKQPEDNRFWVVKGEGPEVLRIEAQTFENGPVWRIDMALVVWR